MRHFIGGILLFFCLSFVQAKSPVEYVNPFIGTTNFGTTNPGAVLPHGLMSVSPFNVMGSDINRFDKDSRWWSAAYESTNSYFTGFAHVNLSGVGCPELSSILLMPTTDTLRVDYKQYGSAYSQEKATPGYYSNFLTRYGIKTEVSATQRTGISRFTFPKGKSNILLNLGEGLTNESGATVKIVSDNEVEGCKLMGTFCYAPQAVFPLYFVMQIDKDHLQSGCWKKQRMMKGVESEWDIYSGKNKLYPNFRKDMSGDDIGVYFTFETEANETVDVRIGVSMVSIANARQNLQLEQKDQSFNKIVEKAASRWDEDLSQIEVEGGTEVDKTVFYTALYHTLIHPSVLQDVNGDYPMMESSKIGNTKKNRYTVFSLWDTYRNVHPLMTILFPDRQLDMVTSLVDMYKESGCLPKWELFGRETHTMTGDPCIPVIADTWLKGLRDFDMETAYRAMLESATLPSAKNILRPQNDLYMKLGFLPLLGKFDHSVSTSLEFYLADWNLSRVALSLGKTKDAETFARRAQGYKHFYDKESGVLRPKLADGTFLTPFIPTQGANFEPVSGFHEGSAWNYAFFVPHDVVGLSKLMGGKKPFVEKLQQVFDKGLFDMANEPDIAYPYLFNYFKGEEWRTQKMVQQLVRKHFKNAPDGLPGNDDTGTMSAWVLFSMMGFYPDCPGSTNYCLTTPFFDKITIHLSTKYYPNGKLVIEKKSTKNTNQDVQYIQRVMLDSTPLKKYIISHKDLMSAQKLTFYCK